MYYLIQRRGNVGSTLFKEEGEGEYTGVEYFIERFDLSKECVDGFCHLKWIFINISYSPEIGSILTISDSELEVPSAQVPREPSMEVDADEGMKESTPELVVYTQDAEPSPLVHHESPMSDPPISSSRLSMEPEELSTVKGVEPPLCLVYPEVEAVKQGDEVSEPPVPLEPRSPSLPLPTSQEIVQSSVRDASPIPTQVSVNLEEPPPTVIDSGDLELCDALPNDFPSSPPPDVSLEAHSNLPSRQPSLSARSKSVAQLSHNSSPEPEPEPIVTKVELEDIDMEDIVPEDKTIVFDARVPTKEPTAEAEIVMPSPKLTLPSYEPTIITIRSRLTPITAPPSYNFPLEPPPSEITEQPRSPFPLPNRGYALPPLKGLPPEFQRKSKSGKQQKKREKERDKGDSRRETKEEWQSHGLNKLGVIMRANPIYRKISRTAKCLSTADWNVRFLCPLRCY